MTTRLEPDTFFPNATSSPTQPVDRRAAHWATWLVFPSLLAAMIAGTVSLLQTDLPLPVASGLPMVATVLSVLLLERVFPEHPSWNRRPDGTDLGLLVLNRGIDIALLAGTSAMFAWLAGAWLSHPSSALWPRDSALALQVVLGIGIGEAIRYGLHRISHRPGLLGRVHETHHRPDRMYSLNGPRLHPLNYAWAAGAHTVPMLLLGAEITTAIVVINITGFFVVLQHANLRLRFDGLNWVFATPDVHRLHHLRDSPEGDKNFAIILSVFDQVFGTYARPRPIRSDAIGVGSR